MVKKLIKENVSIPEGQTTAFCTYKLLIYLKFCIYLNWLYVCMYTYTPTYLGLIVVV